MNEKENSIAAYESFHCVAWNFSHFFRCLVSAPPSPLRIIDHVGKAQWHSINPTQDKPIEDTHVYQLITIPEC